MSIARSFSAHLTAAAVTTLVLFGAAACASDVTVAQPAPPVAAAPVAAATATTTTQTSPVDVLHQAEDAWRNRDWNRLDSYATADVVAIAQAAGSPEDIGPLGSTNSVGVAWQCALEGAACTDGLWACDAGGSPCNGEILYGHEPDAACCAAIYRVTIADTGNGFRLTSLSFAGDAG